MTFIPHPYIGIILTQNVIIIRFFEGMFIFKQRYNPAYFAWKILGKIQRLEIYYENNYIYIDNFANKKK